MKEWNFLQPHRIRDHLTGLLRKALAPSLLRQGRVREQRKGVPMKKGVRIIERAHENRA